MFFTGLSICVLWLFLVIFLASFFILNCVLMLPRDGSALWALVISMTVSFVYVICEMLFFVNGIQKELSIKSNPTEKIKKEKPFQNILSYFCDMLTFFCAILFGSTFLVAYAYMCYSLILNAFLDLTALPPIMCKIGSILGGLCEAIFMIYSVSDTGSIIMGIIGETKNEDSKK